jgi:hypothetical protein
LFSPTFCHRIGGLARELWNRSYEPRLKMIPDLA